MSKERKETAPETAPSKETTLKEPTDVTSPGEAQHQICLDKSQICATCTMCVRVMVWKSWSLCLAMAVRRN